MSFLKRFSGAFSKQWLSWSLRWLPLILFIGYVIVAVAMKDRERDSRAAAGPVRAEAHANCEKICDTMAVCALAQFGQTAANEALVPQLKNNCYSGCLLQEEKVSVCFQQDLDCFALTQCAVQYLYQRQ